MRSRFPHLSLVLALALAPALLPSFAGTAAAVPPPAGGGDLQIGPPVVVPPHISLVSGGGYEADGVVDIKVVLNKPAQIAVSFDYTINHNGTEDHDFAFLAGNMLIPAGVTNTVLSLPVTQDDGPDGSEGFVVVGSNPVGAMFYSHIGIGTIWDDDGPDLSVGDAEVVEGDEGETALEFEITSSYPAPEVFSVRAASAIVGMGAVPPGDYTPVDQYVVLGVGSDSETVQVPVLGDTLVEADELLLLLLDPPEIGGLTDGAGVGRILDDDEPTVAIDDVTLEEGTGGPTGFHFTVSLDQPALEEVTVTATPTDGTAVAPGDWQGVPVDVTFEPGQTEADVVVSVVGDSDIEDDESFTVVLSDVVGASIADDEGLGTIVDDDAETPPDDSTDDGVTEVAGAGTGRGDLPRTGATVGALAGAGLLLVLAGFALQRLRRRSA
jgi:LPXTG-motif cell wall-anchored protein